MLTFLPRSLQALAISRLFIFVMAIAALILALVTFLVLWIAFRYRSRPGQQPPPQIEGNTKFEIAWTVLPASLLLVIFGFTIRAMAQADPRVSDQQKSQPDLVIIGHQWWWEIKYPQAGIVTANEVHLPVGKPLVARFESADVIHDFWVPQIGRKIDMIPGHPNTMILQADTPGVYPGACAEFCGAEHAWMRIRVIAEPLNTYTTWLKSQAQSAVSPSSDLAAKGALLFQQKTCSNCHTIQGTPAQGTAGPDLTHIASRQTLGAGRMDNTPKNLLEWIDNPGASKPGTYMPDLGLTGDELRAIVAYMETLK